MTDVGAPAGWYPDPRAPGTLRWWNGSSWTSQTQAAIESASTPSQPIKQPVGAGSLEPKSSAVWAPPASDGLLSTELDPLVNCAACNAEVPPARICRNCGALLAVAKPPADVVAAVPPHLTMTGADLLTGDEKTLAYLCSLVVRAATGELSEPLRAELEVVASDALQDVRLGDLASQYAKSVLTGSPDWYPQLRRLRARLLADARCELLSFCIATTNYGGLDVGGGPGLRRVDAVLDALDSDDSADDWQIPLESLVQRLIPEDSPSAAAKWLPLAKQAAPAVSLGAQMLGHGWVAMALDAAAQLTPDEIAAKPSSTPSDIELARQLALVAALMIVGRESDLESAERLVHGVPELVSHMRTASDRSASVLAEFLEVLTDQGFAIPHRKMEMVGYLLPSARRLVQQCGWTVEVRATNADGTVAGVWTEGNWRVTGALFGAPSHVTFDVRKAF